MFVNDLVGSLVPELINTPSSCDIMHVIQFHQIDVQVKWISQILMDIRPRKNLLKCVFKNIYNEMNL
jgi:hypothetical protein